MKKQKATRDYMKGVRATINAFDDIIEYIDFASCMDCGQKAMLCTNCAAARKSGESFKSLLMELGIDYL